MANRQYSTEFRQQVLDWHHQHGTTQRTTANKFNMPRTTLTGWVNSTADTSAPHPTDSSDHKEAGPNQRVQELERQLQQLQDDCQTLRRAMFLLFGQTP
ncbi:transposase [Ferrimonas balearica]|uniref:transposase n=1 Tax=Ferrimonas balearica TaxID=44012 RepID=UPI001C571D01|nr:transposase [Ferrimonas balearica]MBW3140558.1 transposase [Ferrimonas balearica]